MALYLEVGLEEVQIFSTKKDDQEEEFEEGTWKETYLQDFRNLLRFLVAGHEGEILNMMNSISASILKLKGKGV